MADLTYDGPIKLYTTDQKGDPLVTGPNSPTPGTPYRKVSFKVADGWLNLADFKGLTDGIHDGDHCHVVYWQKFDNRGEPVLAQGKYPQYNLDSIQITGQQGAQQAQNGPTTAPATPSTAAPAFDAKTQDIRRAVAIKAATELTCAMLPHLTDAAAFAYLDRVFEDAARIEAWLESGKVPNELDEMMAAAKDKLMDDVADDDDDIPFG